LHFCKITLIVQSFCIKCLYIPAKTLGKIDYQHLGMFCTMQIFLILNTTQHLSTVHKSINMIYQSTSRIVDRIRNITSRHFFNYDYIVQLERGCVYFRFQSLVLISMVQLPIQPVQTHWVCHTKYVAIYLY